MQARRWHDVFSSSELHGRDLDSNVTILPGVASRQGQDIRAIKERLDGMDEELTRKDNGVIAAKWITAARL